MSTREFAAVVRLLFPAAIGCFAMASCGGGGNQKTSTSGQLVAAVSDLPAQERPSRAPGKSLTLTRMETPPDIDGKLDEEGWESATTTEPFAPVDVEGDSARATVCALSYDDLALYVAFRCSDEDPAKLSAGPRDRDGDLTTDDWVDIRLDLSQVGRDVARFVVSASGVQSDAWCTQSTEGVDCDLEWNAEWQAAAHVGERDWTVEMAIPFAELGLPGLVEGMRWGVDLRRHDARRQQVSSWAAGGDSEGAPATLGVIALGETPIQVTLKSAGELTWGRSKGELAIENAGEQSVPLDVRVEFAGGTDVGKGDMVTIIVPKQGSRVVEFSYDVKIREGADALILSVAERGSEELRYFARMPFEVAALLDVSLAVEEFPVSAETAAAQVHVDVGRESLGDLRVELGVAAKDEPGTKLTGGTIKAPPGSAEVVLDLSALGEGEYVLTGNLEDSDGNSMHEVQRPFRRTADVGEEADPAEPAETETTP